MNDTGLLAIDSDGNPLTIREARDSYNVSHTITKKLGEGGQGLVCMTENPEIVLKFILDGAGSVISRAKDQENFQKNLKKIEGILSKPFPDRLHLAFPMAHLADFSGYVMRMMRDMKPFKDLQSIGSFPETGGHRRRFELLSRLALVLAHIHGCGMVYCDISPNNVFVSASPEIKTQNVWLIDADNIFVPGFDDNRLVYTPRYAAPELFENTPCSQNSDCYSFAILAFECLAAVHPFEGDKATNWEDESDDWDKSVSTQQSVAEPAPEVDPRYSGKYPWIENPDDESNHTKNGLPRQFFLSEETFTLFNLTFTIGKTEPERRPRMVFWARAFARSSDCSVECRECQMSFVHDSGMDACPWCEKELPSRLVLKDKGRVVFVRELDFDEGKWIEFPERIFSPFDIQTSWNTLLECRREKEDGHIIEFRIPSTAGIGGHSFYLSSSKGVRDKIKGRYSLEFKEKESYFLEYEESGTGQTRKLELEVIGGKDED